MTEKSLFEKVYELTHHQPIREMSRLGKFDDLTLGRPNPAFLGDSNEIEGYPTIPKEFENLQRIIPDSDWWWLSSGSDVHNKKGSTQGVGSFEFRFTSRSFFFFRCIYDPFVGFTKIEIGYDNVDVSISDPKRITIENMEEIVEYRFSEMWNFILKNCNVNGSQRQTINKLLSGVKNNKK